MADAWTLLTQGKIWEAMLNPYIATLTEPLFYTIILTSLLALVYIKTRNIELTAAIIMLAGFALIPIVSPKSRIYFLVIAALGAAIAIYNALWRRAW